MKLKNLFEIKIFYFSSNTSEIRYSDNDFKNNEILDILPKLWFAYEHLCFRFTNVKKIIILMIITVNLGMKLQIW